MLKAGTLLGERYEIVGRIGSGGMADVYKAKDRKLNRFVAVKVMKAEFKNDNTFITKFRREAQAAAGLANPNIVNVFDVGDDNGSYYIVMELVEGITLKEYIGKKGKLSVREATSIAIQVCMGLAAAHAQGIVHRDVKPQNIMISTDGKVKVTDFGIARAVSSNTISANAMGSVHYSSPEQVRGGYADAKSDIYSVGITLYEMVAGRVPFDGDTTVAIAIKHLQDEMEPPSKYTPDLPYSLEQIIYKCTQKSVDRRYATMNEVISDLKHSLIEPNGHFVQLTPLSDHAKTMVLTNAQINAIKDAAEKGRRETEKDAAVYHSKEDAQSGRSEKQRYEPDPEEEEYRERRAARRRRDDIEEDDDDDEEGISGKLEKAMTIGGFIVGALIICILIYFIGRAAGIFRFGGNTNSSSSSGSAVESSQPIVVVPDGVPVPQLVGMTEQEAQKAVSDLGLGIKYQGEEPSASIQEGRIARQDPVYGSSVEKNTTIYYWRSSGESGSQVPDVAGRSLSEAQSILTGAGFTNLIVNQQSSDTVTINNVISTTPAAGETADYASLITITVSTGPVPTPPPQSQPESSSSEEPQPGPQPGESVVVLSYTGLPLDQAQQACESIGLVVKLAYGSSNQVGEGEVMEQSIAPETTVPAGTEITLTINASDGETPPPESQAESQQSEPESQTPQVAMTWSCNERLGAPSNYTGGAYRLTLEQAVNGSPAEVIIDEGSVITFPYELRTSGAEGVPTGTVHLYEMVQNAYVIRANWEVPFSP